MCKPILRRLFFVVSILIALEVVSSLLLVWTAGRQTKILQQRLAGRKIESLDEAERKHLQQSVADEFAPTTARKVELVVIAFHIPALASWGVATGGSETPPIYYYGITIAFWFTVVLGIMKVAGKIRGGEGRSAGARPPINNQTSPSPLKLPVRPPPLPPPPRPPGK